MSVIDCQGQERAIIRLERARRSSRVPHSYIFYGPEGVGKSLLARQWAKLLLCEKPVKRDMSGGPTSGAAFESVDDCCDTCRECRLVDAGTHQDYHVITRDLAKYTKKARKSQPLEMPIDVIREFVIDKAGVAPVHGRARIFVIDQAETMNRESQNALLKTLEEPSVNTFLILVTAQLHVMLPTVRSRCQIVRFDELAAAYIKSRLVEKGVNAEEAALWSELAEGSLGRALELSNLPLEQLPQKIVNLLQKISYESVLEGAAWLIDQGKVLGAGFQKMNPELSTSDATRRGQRYCLHILNFAFDQALRSLAGQPLRVELPGVREIGDRYGLDGASRAIRMNYRTESYLGLNVNPALLFESLMLDYMDYAQSR